MKIIVGSKNPVKTRAVRRAFGQYFKEIEVEGFRVLSKVPSQPKGKEVFQGAENRALAVERINRGRELGGEYFVGIESGLIEYYERWFVGSAVCIYDGEGHSSFGTAPWFEVPSFFLPRVMEGTELGILIDRFSGTKNSGRKGGAVGFLSKGEIKRADIYTYGVTMALLPFIQRGLYFDSEKL